MKKILFTLVMIAALAMVAGTAKAQTNAKTVLPGGKYSYILDGVGSAKDANATVSYDAGGGTPATINNEAGLSISAGTTGANITFDVTYGTVAAPASSGTITVVVTDGTCSNSIELEITVLPMPTITLALTTTGSTGCQVKGAAGDNAPEAKSGGDPAHVNTFTFTVTPVIDIHASYTGTISWTYDIVLPTAGGLQNYSITGGPTSVTGTVSHNGIAIGAIAPDVYTVEFHTTTGIDDVALAASINISASNLSIPIIADPIDATLTSGGSDNQSITVRAMPSIGGFN